MPYWVIILILFVCNLGLYGCETIQGLGQDLENAGENIQNLGDKLNPPKEKE